MATVRELRQRTKSVKSIQHITKAMKMVAASRLRRAQERAAAGKIYALKIREMLNNIIDSEVEFKDELLQKREVKTVAYCIIGSDKGLAGAYNSNVIKKALEEFNYDDKVKIITVGRKVREYFARRNYKVEKSFENFSEKPAYTDAVELVRFMKEKYLSGEYDEIRITYTEFISPLLQEPVSVKLFPIEPPKLDNDDKHQKTEYLFEPSAEETMSILLPRYLEMEVFAALMQAATSEFGSRMTAMTMATDNSSEIIDKLTLQYNKIRQAGITSEISEIVAGAEALK